MVSPRWHCYTCGRPQGADIEAACTCGGETFIARAGPAVALSQAEANRIANDEHDAIDRELDAGANLRSALVPAELLKPGAIIYECLNTGKPLAECGCEECALTWEEAHPKP